MLGLIGTDQPTGHIAVDLAQMVFINPNILPCCGLGCGWMEQQPPGKSGNHSQDYGYNQDPEHHN